MSQTIDRPMTVIQARQLLQDTSSLSNESIDAANATVAAFYALRPPAGHQCPACGCMRFSEHEGATDGQPKWACSGCHRSATLTPQQWHEQHTAERKAAGLAATAAEAAKAAQPAPRAVLRERLAALAEANAAAEKLEKTVPVARSNAWAAQERVEAAEAAAAEANAGAAANLADALATGKPIGPASSAARARAALAEAVDAAVLAKNGRTILESRLTDAKSAVAFAMDKVRKSCLQVIADEKMSDLLGSAIAGRAQYIDAIGQLAWLLRSHAIDDAGVRQFVNEAATALSTWPESANAGASAMERCMNALLADAAAVI